MSLERVLLRAARAEAALSRPPARIPRRRRMGVVPALVLEILRGAGAPLGLADIHTDVVAMLGPVSNGTTKNALSRMAADPDFLLVRRVARGFYTVV